MTNRIRARGILAIAFLAQFFSIGVTLFSFGLYVAPLEQEFQIGRAALNSGMLVMMIGMSLFSAVIGRFLDRIEIRYLMAAGTSLLAFGMLGIANSTSLLAITLYIAIPMSIGVSVLGPLCATTLINNWFDEGAEFGLRRGTAMGLATVSTSFGGILIAPLTAHLISEEGWRHALSTEAVLLWLVLTPLVLLLVRNFPQSDLTTPKTQTDRSNTGQISATTASIDHHSETALTAKNIVLSFNFWPIVFSVGILFAINQAFMISLVPYAQSLSIDVKSAAQLISVIACFGIAGKLLFGWLAERIAKTHLIFTAGLITGLFFLTTTVYTPNFITLGIACSIFGFFTAGVFPVWTSLIGDCYNKASYGAVMGLMQLFMLPLNLAMVVFVGTVFDLNGDYTFAFGTFVGLVGLSLLATRWIKSASIRV